MNTTAARAIAPIAGTMLILAGGCGFNPRPGAQTLFELVGPTTPAEAAEMALDAEDTDRRFRGTMMLANAPFGGEAPYIAMYEDYTTDEAPNVRAAATRALGNHGDPARHVPMIIERLESEERVVRIEAARALQRLHNPAAIEPLVRRLDPDIEPEPDIRAEAAHALGQYADPTVVQVLIATLADRHLRVARNARKALKTLTGQDFGLDRSEWSQWVSSTDNPFAGRTPYVYPAYARGRRLHEFIPFIPPPPNEEPSTPAGFRDAYEVRGEGTSGGS